MLVTLCAAQEGGLPGQLSPNSELGAGATGAGCIGCKKEYLQKSPAGLTSGLEAATAALYDGETCRRAIKQADRLAWELVSECCHVSKAREMHLRVSSPWTKALYVRNQKAASTYLFTAVVDIFDPVAQGRARMQEGDPALLMSKHKAPWGYAADARTLVHTAVRARMAAVVTGA